MEEIIIVGLLLIIVYLITKKSIKTQVKTPANVEQIQTEEEFINSLPRPLKLVNTTYRCHEDSPNLDPLIYVGICFLDGNGKIHSLSNRFGFGGIIDNLYTQYKKSPKGTIILS